MEDKPTSLQNEDLLFSSNDPEKEVIALLLTDNFLITHINSLQNDSLFHNKKQNLLGKSFIDLFSAQKMDTIALLHAFKHSQELTFQLLELECPVLKKTYSITIIALKGNPSADYAVTVTTKSHSYQLLQSYLNAIINNLPGAVYWKDLEGHYLGCNKMVAQMAGYANPHEIIGKTDYDLVWSEFADDWRQLDNKVAKENTTIQREEKVRLANGEVRTELTFKSPLKNEYDKIVGTIGTSLDITERKKMEKELIQAQKNAEAANFIMTEFISNMGHDLSTPISDVGGIAQLLLCYGDEYPELKEDFEILAMRSEDCEKVRKHIINATSIANLEIKPKKFSIALMLLALEKELRPTIGSKNLKIVINPWKPKKEDFIVTDPIKFHDILYNLISNAINFTEEGQITLSVIKEDNLFHIEVSDTGIGIPSDKYDYIFEQYTKLSRSNKYGATFKGVGAGLYLAKLRANILNATISVKSEVGKGSTFTLSIPTHPNTEE